MVSLRSLAAALGSAALLFASSAAAHSVKRNPVEYVSLVEDIDIRTTSHRVRADSEFDVTFALHNGQQRVRLQLEPNHDILHDTFAVTYLDSEGQVQRVEQVDRWDHKVFKGHAFTKDTAGGSWSKAGWARITIHRDGLHPVFEGTFRIDGDHHHIQTGAHYDRLKHAEDPLVNFHGDPEEVMVVWRDSDIRPDLKRDVSPSMLCESDNLDFNTRYHELRSVEDFSAVNARSLFGRQTFDDGSNGNGAGVNLIDTIGSIDGCPTTRKVALVGIATDCTYTGDFNSSESMRKNIINQVNAASQVYESTFNISLGIQNLTVSNESCPGSPPSSAPWNIGCSDSVTIADRLNLFSKWRGQFDDTNAYWTLLSKCNTEAAVGLAWLGQVCRTGASDGNGQNGKNESVAGANVVVRTSTEWQVFAHESGHTFGAVHDCTDQTCPQSSGVQTCCPLSDSSCDAKAKFIMNPSAAPGITNFSPCSIGNICSGFKRNIKTDCLTDNKNIKTFTGKQCGNGIVEDGEDCDCGGEQGCGSNNCCDPKTCKFKSGAVCDPTNEDCCTDQCQFAASGKVCRASAGDCDPEEVCTGSSANCPKDDHKEDGASCGDGLKCASGQCTSRDVQCRNMVGNMTSARDVQACESSGCLLSCKSPDFGYNTCAEFNQYFIDGTTCAGGGRCENGACKGSSTIKEVGDWFNDHKGIAIPVACVIGGLILLAMLSCIWSCIRRARNRRRAPKPTEMTTWPSPYAQGANPNMPDGPPPAYSYTPIDGNQQWHRGRSVRYA